MADGFTRWVVAGAAVVVAAALAGVSAQAATKYAVHRYTTEDKAQKHCPKDAVVYSTGHNGTYFLKGDAQYGHIKNAWYVCRREADHGGWHLQAH